MTTADVLYPPGQRPAEQDGRQPPQEPACFSDLNLGQVVADVTANRPDDGLTALYWSALRDLDTLRYRQEVFRDLDRADISDLVRTFAQRRLVYQFRYRTKEIREDDHGLQHYYRTRFFLNAVDEYCQAVL